ncbi:hypothetical protein GCM10010260_82830 [Streptomyces filipinensis]|uniref:ATP-dependent DNA ligase family profile domain-containing protein n=1 Tax=Streptomyces filipinensis TaxID=66887 RepID=A0A918IL26_9ACTN|nr:hypothetical protein [Streptomyces filipinensis]GGV29739.1 hypothetical protein GCM10010260_82830 [Streptomyces filipinensis]
MPGLLSRTGQRLDETCPEIVAALAAQECADFTVDGEVVAFTGGRTGFARPQRRMGLTLRRDIGASGVAVTYHVVDLLRLEGADTRRLPLRLRKPLLRRALSCRTPLRQTPHRHAGGAALPDRACTRGWEGLIARRAGGPYRTSRSTDWLKLKCAQGQEFVIGGFTEPAGLGALLRRTRSRSACSACSASCRTAPFPEYAPDPGARSRGQVPGSACSAQIVLPRPVCRLPQRWVSWATSNSPRPPSS